MPMVNTVVARHLEAGKFAIAALADKKALVMRVPAGAAVRLPE